MGNPQLCVKRLAWFAQSEFPFTRNGFVDKLAAAQ
jgi:hypothetical protein